MPARQLIETVDHTYAIAVDISASANGACHTILYRACFSTQSAIAGVVFLCLFFCWGLLYIRSHTRSAACKMGQSFWGALAASAAALLIGQIILHIIYAAGNAEWATDAHTKRVLQLFGLTKANDAKHIILVRD